ncbi:MAG: CHASE2 domain-containing protein [Xenococcaceae cyanobacterium MO_188.B29]|nr:CHASE2 domain-containing protein [Xenococcaceae cyanobacterium MO_188.B29]
MSIPLPNILMTDDNEIFSYQIGGSLASTSPSYVERQADRELDEALREGQFCYILNSRQMGKSSLRVRAMERLQAEGTVCIFIDLTGMGTQDLTPEKWYAGIIRSIVSACQLRLNWRNWWREKRDLCTPAQRLNLFIEEVLLVEVSSKIVIFIDEIDRVLSQKFSLDDFFALIHSCYQKRQVNPDYNRLTFTLLGVAAPRDLIRDKTQSPFNVGKAINLEGFKLEEAFPLMLGLANRVSDPQNLLADILSWTGGQPFLTQKLCQLVREQGNCHWKIEEIVEKHIIDDWEKQDEPEHLRTIRDRLCYRDSSKTIRLLGLYREIVQQGRVPFNNSCEQRELCLSGLVVERQGNLEVNNPIYAWVFNLAWVDNQLSQLRPYDRSLIDWVATDYRDPNHLLTGKDLQDALTWALGKSLADIDYRFLVASQDLAKQEAQDALAAVEAASQLLATARKQARQRVNKQRLEKKGLAQIALGVTGFILLMRFTGILQSWEWNLLDRFFRWRVADAQESRIVVVTIDEDDIKTVGQWPIPDGTLATAIKNLQAQQPSAIGLDIYRDLPVPPGNQDLIELFNSTPNLYVVEKVIDYSIPPPPNVSPTQVGFADQVLDSDGKVRRALLSLVGDDEQKRLSLSTKLALHYLQERKIQLEPLNQDRDNASFANRYRLGKAIFTRFTGNDGGYVGADSGGYQILLNFWGTEANFRQYSLKEVLNKEITPENIRDRLILIGSTAESIKDFFYTPYSQGWFSSPQKMYGVFIQAKITSQIISAAMDNRPLLRTHNELSESLWILLWGIIGAIISWRLQSSVSITLSVILTSSLLIIICYLAFLLGWWLPVVPSLLTLVATIITAILIRNRQRDRRKFDNTLAFLLKEYRERPIVGRIALEYLKQSENKDKSCLIDQKIK